MAEYIDKETVLNLLKDINDDIGAGYGFQYQDWVDEVKNEISENVIERSKIDKAIEEIKSHCGIDDNGNIIYCSISPQEVIDTLLKYWECQFECV